MSQECEQGTGSTVYFLSNNVWASVGKTEWGVVGGFDMTPRVWNHLKIIQSHVWCLGCDDSKARTADGSAHTWLDMWRDFLQRDSLRALHLLARWLGAPNARGPASQQQVDSHSYPGF